MNIICTPNGIVEFLYPNQGMQDIASAGFVSVMLDMRIFCPARELEYLDSARKYAGNRALVWDDPALLQGYAEKFVAFAEKNELKVPIAYAVSLPRTAKEYVDTERIQVLVEESIKAAAKAEAKYIVVSPLYAGIERADRWEQNKVFYLRLAELIRDTNMMILLENQCVDKDGHMVRGLCSDAAEAVCWIDNLNRVTMELGCEQDVFGFCMDTGTCNLCGQDMQAFALTLGHRIKAVVLRDCDGYMETSMLPFTCVNYGQSRTDWLSLIRSLRTSGFDGELILDFGDTARAFSPLLKPELMRLAKSVADYFKWQIEMERLLEKYDSFVLFGAGNMCRNFMTNYGENHPPLFTCDNNAKIWGSRVCELEIKSPESLKELPKDTAIFICNVYYREIVQQIRQMGIENPIEFFNDEFLPVLGSR